MNNILISSQGIPAKALPGLFYTVVFGNVYKTYMNRVCVVYTTVQEEYRETACREQKLIE